MKRGIKRTDTEKHDYMSIEMTNSIKGFFLFMVFFTHIWTYTDFSNPYFDYPYQIVRKLTGQCIVTMFLFYSGYGIMESIKKKGQNYVHRIPIYRFLNVLLHFDCAIMLFWLYRQLTGHHYNIKTILLTLIGWSSIGNSNWYIFCILCVYIFTFISFTTFKNSHIKAVISIFILSLLYMAIMYKAGKEYWWYDTVLSYSWGMFFSLYRARIENLIHETFNSWIFFLIVFPIGHLVTYFYKNTNQIIYQIWVFCFIATIVTFTMCFVIDSQILQWCGRHLFELYILQRLPMMILKPHILVGQTTALTNYMYLIASIIITIIISFLFQKIISKAIKKTINSLCL